MAEVKWLRSACVDQMVTQSGDVLAPPVRREVATVARGGRALRPNLWEERNWVQRLDQRLCLHSAASLHEAAL